MNFAGLPVVKNPPANAGDTALTPGLERFHRPSDNQACPCRACAAQQERALRWEARSPRGRTASAPTAGENNDDLVQQNI